MTGHYAVFTASLLCTALIGYMDHLTGAQVSMLMLYAVPVLLSSRYCGRIEGVIVACGAAVSWIVVNQFHKLPGDSYVIFSWNAFTRFGIFVLIAYAVSLQGKLKHALAMEALRADTDSLTGLLNKGAFRDRMEEELNRTRRYNHPLSLAFVDLDNFKQINDSQGHTRGDKLLQDVGETLRNAIRNTDIPGRIGGDEFAICFPEADEESVRKAIRKLVQALDIMTSQSGWQVTASIGVVTCVDLNETYDSLLGTADRLMYAAKEKGKNTVEFMTLGK
ncbi:MAG: diguanylate cyclase [Desulfuromonadaceae bacterium]|nr:diguanylate cyclase [Desulfuromonadaceae bacterium]